MKECKEYIVKVGMHRDPKSVFDEVESVSADMIRAGWALADTCMEDGLGKIHLLFERYVESTKESEIRYIQQENA